MEILLNFEFCEEEELKLSKAKRERAIKEAGLEGVEAVEMVNIGPGADYFVVLFLLSLGLQAIKLGSEINDGIEGWLGLGKKLRSLFERERLVSVDSEGATALAIVLLARKIKIEKLEKIQESSLNLVDLSGMIPGNKGLSQRPHNYYIQSYRINDMEVYVVGIQSNGKAEIIKHFGYNPYGVWEVEEGSADNSSTL